MRGDEIELRSVIGFQGRGLKLLLKKGRPQDELKEMNLIKKLFITVKWAGRVLEYPKSENN